MDAKLPAALDSTALSRRLAELAGDQRALQVEFLLHLEEYDRRRAFVDAGHASLWEFLTRALHYREGAAYRRIAGMKALRRVPRLADALREGQLCLTTLALLDEVLTPENACDLLARCAFQSKREVEHVVASVRPRPAPKDGVRRMPVRNPAAPAVLPVARALPDESAPAAPAPILAQALGPPPPSLVEKRAKLRPVSAEAYSLSVTIDAELKAELDELKALLSHKYPTGDLRSVLREAVRCAIEKHGKRKGAVEPARKRKPPVAGNRPAPSREPTLEVRRQVWKRDGGRCTWVGPDGKPCGSRWRLEYDHVHPAALGGAATVENGRLLCRHHQQLSAEQTFGREHMEKCRRRSQKGDSTSPGGSSGASLLPCEPLLLDREHAT
jgi:5-methylcytosine-specific restriction endonuclease McrA